MQLEPFAGIASCIFASRWVQTDDFSLALLRSQQALPDATLGAWAMY